VTATITGNSYWFDWSVGPLQAIPGATIELVRDVSPRYRDLTALRSAVAELGESNRRYEEAMDGITCVVWHAEFDSQGRIQNSYSSPEADRYLGLPVGTVRNDFNAVWSHLHPEDIAGTQAKLGECIANPGIVLAHEYRQCRADGEVRWMHVVGRSRPRSDGHVLVFGVTQDITEKRKAEDERERLTQQLQQAKRMESVGRLAGGIAHEFNNILTAILGNIEFVMEDMLPGDPHLAILGDAEKAGRRAAELTAHLLAYSRQTIIRPRVVNLNELMKNAERLLSRLLGERIQIETVLDRDLWNVNVDPGQIEHIVVNLAVNARDAMSDGGKLRLETACVFLDEEYCQQHPEARPGRYAMLAVSDTGCGMPQEVKAKLFEPFFTTKPVGQGTGLGLAMIHGLVKQHGGAIAVDSEVGQGTTVKLYLPALDEVSTAASIESDAAQPVGGAETILLVEDEQVVRRLGNKLLVRLGYRVLESATADEAMRTAEAYPGAIDLLFTDVVLPDDNGRRLADRLLATRPAMRVLFTSGYSANVIAQQGVLEREIQFLEKPYAASELSQKVREVLDTKA
jgi:PAS domain S-box-containing protein